MILSAIFVCVGGWRHFSTDPPKPSPSDPYDLSEVKPTQSREGYLLPSQICSTWEGSMYWLGKMQCCWLRIGEGVSSAEGSFPSSY